MSSRFIITIIEQTTEKRFKGADWEKGGEGDPEKYGYTPEIEKHVSVEREVFKQNVTELDLSAVIKAVNKL